MLILFLTRAGSGAVVVRRCSKTHATSPTTEPPLQRSGGSYSGPMSGDEIWTIGHWVCEQGVFLETLDSAGIGAIADVRAQPGSRRSPQFSRDAMPEWLGEAGIEYHHLQELTGRRRKQPEIPQELNAGWQNRSFKNYADYTLTDDYEDGIAQLVEIARRLPTAIMCGEPMPWRCHRTLIANTLTARGWTVRHLSTTAEPRLHELGMWGAHAEVSDDGVVTYPPSAEDCD